MGLQKYRADKAGYQQQNGGIPWFTNWMGGPSLALIRNCKIERACPRELVACNCHTITPRTVYVRGEPDTTFSIPAACTYKRKTMQGYIALDDNGEYVFRVYCTSS